MDVFVFEVMHTKQNEPKISKTSILLQDVNEECTLSVLKLKMFPTAFAQDSWTINYRMIIPIAA